MIEKTSPQCGPMMQVLPPNVTGSVRKGSWEGVREEVFKNPLIENLPHTKTSVYLKSCFILGN